MSPWSDFAAGQLRYLSRPLPRVPFALRLAAVFGCQGILVVGVLSLLTGSAPGVVEVVLFPSKTLTSNAGWTLSVSILAFTILIASSAAIVILSIRRLADVGWPPWLVIPAIAPLIQVPLLILLALLPGKPAMEDFVDVLPAAKDSTDWVSAALGMIAGMSVAVIAVAMGALAFGTYGYGMFILAPFAVGFAAGLYANLRADVGYSQTNVAAGGALVLSGCALIGFALEGIVCVVFSLPLAVPMAWIGGHAGRAAARRTHHAAVPAMAIVLLFPLVFGADEFMEDGISLESYLEVEVNASPEAVWQSLIEFGPIEEPPAFPFRLGLSYPLGAKIDGEGIGATRLGQFSTGVAVERVTQWEPRRRLGFIVIDDPPALKELSPYDSVHAPHVKGYFQTGLTTFEIKPIPGGRSLLVERTAHELFLEPGFYWVPFARWAVRQNNERVLAHVKRTAETLVTRGASGEKSADALRSDLIFNASLNGVPE